jgi:hypothetical protein
MNGICLCSGDEQASLKKYALPSDELVVEAKSVAHKRRGPQQRFQPLINLAKTCLHFVSIRC